MKYTWHYEMRTLKTIRKNFLIKKIVKKSVCNKRLSRIILQVRPLTTKTNGRCNASPTGKTADYRETK